jgi:flagellar biogenesis protein FliO
MTKRAIFQGFVSLSVIILFIYWNSIAIMLGPVGAMILAFGLFLTFAFEVRYSNRSRLKPEHKLDKKNG